MNNISLLAKKYQNYIPSLISIDSKIFQHINDVTLFHNSKSKNFLDDFYRKASPNSNNYISFLLNPVDKIFNNNLKTVDQFRTDNINNNIINYYSQIFSPYNNFAIKPNIILTESNIDYLIENSINYIFYNNSILNISKEYLLENISYFSRYCIDFVYNDLCSEIDELEPFSNTYVYSNFIKSNINNITSSYYSHIDIISKYESINTLVKHKKTKDKLISELTIWLDEQLRYGRITFHHLNNNISHHDTLIYLFDNKYLTIEDLYTKRGFKLILNTNLIQNKSFDYENPLDKILFSTPNINIDAIIYSDLCNITSSPNNYILSSLYFRFNNVQTNIFNIESIQPKYFDILIKSLLINEYNWLKAFNFDYAILTNYKILTLDILDSLNIPRHKILDNIDSFLDIKTLDDIFLFIDKTYDKKQFSILFNGDLEELKPFLNSFILLAAKYEYDITFKNISKLIPILTEDNLQYVLKTSFFGYNDNVIELFYDDNYQLYHNILLKEEYLNLIINKLKNSESLVFLGQSDNFIKYYDLNSDIIFNMIYDKFIFENRIELSTSLLFLFKHDKNNFYKLINLYCNHNNINLIDFYSEIIFSESYEEDKYEALEYIYLEYFNNTSNTHELIYNIIIYFHNNTESKQNFKKIKILNNLLNSLVDNLIIKKIDLELLIVKYYENYSDNFLHIHRQIKFTNFLCLKKIFTILNYDDKVNFIKSLHYSLPNEIILNLISFDIRLVYQTIISNNENIQYRTEEFNTGLVELFLEKKWNILHLLVFLTHISVAKNSRHLRTLIEVIYNKKLINIIGNFNIYTYIDFTYIGIHNFIYSERNIQFKFSDIITDTNRIHKYDVIKFNNYLKTVITKNNKK